MARKKKESTDKAKDNMCENTDCRDYVEPGLPITARCFQCSHFQGFDLYQKR